MSSKISYHVNEMMRDTGKEVASLAKEKKGGNAFKRTQEEGKETGAGSQQVSAVFCSVQRKQEVDGV